jgi:hypothetical protein
VDTHGRRIRPTLWLKSSRAWAWWRLSPAHSTLRYDLVRNAREDLRATQIMMQEAEAIRLCTWDKLSNLSFLTQP